MVDLISFGITAFASGTVGLLIGGFYYGSKYWKLRHGIIDEKDKDLERKLKTYDQDVKSADLEYRLRLDDLKEIYANKMLQLKEEEDAYCAHIKEEENAALAELQSLKDSLSAGVQAKLREQEIEKKADFYKISNVTDADLRDIAKINEFKETLSSPIVMNKLIWSQYFQSYVTELCNRILGKEKICGIYKITNTLTGQCYIGQSVDVATRWKQHCKCGLGIDASATNKLYSAMQKDGIWNFTFELLESCDSSELNEKEKRFIDLYQSDKFGYNMTKGNS